jgi:FtsP/CotA-like multicopper oxidase with cupredoxin domain
MSRSQRLTFLGIAAAIAVVAVVVILAASGGDDDPGTQASATQTATPTPTQDQPEASPEETETPTPTPTPKPKPPLLKGGKVTRLEYKEGDTVRFRVVSDEPEEVHIHGYDIAKDLEPGKEITVTFKATIEGIFEIEYEHAGEQIGELRVEP